MHRITGRSYRDEATSPTYDLLEHILARRQKWLGHVLRSHEAFLPRRVLLGEVQEHKAQGRPYKHGSLLSEASTHSSVEELVEIAELRDEWSFWSWLEHWAGKPAAAQSYTSKHSSSAERLEEEYQQERRRIHREAAEFEEEYQQERRRIHREGFN